MSGSLLSSEYFNFEIDEIVVKVEPTEQQSTNGGTNEDKGEQGQSNPKVEVDEELMQDHMIETQPPSKDDEIDIKYEDVGYPYAHYLNSDAKETESDHDFQPGPSTSTSPRSTNPVKRGSVNSQVKDRRELCPDLFKCEWDSDTQKLSEHVRTTHAVAQPLMDSLLIAASPFHIDQSTDPEVKSEIGDCFERLEYSVEGGRNNFETEPNVSGLENGVKFSVQLSCMDQKIVEMELLPQKYGHIEETSQTLNIHTGETHVTRPQNLIEQKKTHLSGAKKVQKGKQKKVYKCDDCEQTFTSMRLFASHKRKHTRPFKCHLCEKTFSANKNLTIHMRIHTRENVYKCDVCEKSYTQQYSLTKHQRSHTGEKPYKCYLCERSFSLNKYLTDHMTIHTGERPYKCDACEKSYTRLIRLTEHKRSHTGEKPYKCDLCEKSFSIRGVLIKHLKIHTETKTYNCDLCDKRFQQRSYLVVHKRIHTRDKPYSCDLCGKSFALNTRLTLHRRIHTGEKLYKCEECEKSFLRQSSLTLHEKIHISHG